MKISIKDLPSKCDQIRSFLRILSHLLQKPLLENVIFCAVSQVFEACPKSYRTKLSYIKPRYSLILKSTFLFQHQVISWFNFILKRPDKFLRNFTHVQSNERRNYLKKKIKRNSALRKKGIIMFVKRRNTCMKNPKISSYSWNDWKVKEERYSTKCWDGSCRKLLQ